MALVTETLLGTEDKVEHAIETLKAFEPKEGYYLAFSGGKDSVTVKALCDMAGVKYDAHYRVTSVDPPELVRFIKEVHPDVEFEYPRYKDGTRINMWNLIPRKGLPPTRIQRYCCEYLKESGGYGRITLTGVRWAESTNRKNNQGLVTIMKAAKQEHPDSFKSTSKGGLVLMSDNEEARDFMESCYRMKKTNINPIIDWKDEDVWEFIHKYKIPYCKLYDEGLTRLGCIGCPMGSGKGQKRDFERWPKYKKLYLMAFDKFLKKNPSKFPNWHSAQDVFDWWVGDISYKTDGIEGQLSIDDDFMREVRID